MKKLLLILFLVIFSFSAIGKNKYQTEVPYEVPIGQSILCEQEENVGFSWEDKKYVLSRYKKKKIIFKKINPNAKDILGKVCTLELKEKYTEDYDIVSKLYSILHRCYSYQYMGGKVLFNLCKENYDKEKLKSIGCGNYKFDPDGLFLDSPPETSLDLSRDTKYKDSFSISHGKCARF